MRELDSATVESSELVNQTFQFWFSDNQHIRSPFPSYIHSDLRVKATEKFYKWAKNLDPKAKDELNDEAIGEKFEECIFETALGLIKTEDEKITILYPFLPRLNDQIKDASNREGVIVDRYIYKEKDTSFLKVKCKTMDEEEFWETSFELPL